MFDAHGLEVELVAPLGRGAEPVHRVAAGDADACFTSVHSFLSAAQDAGGRPGARFVAVAHQRSAVAAIVRADSPLRIPADLAGRRLAVSQFGWFLAEWEGALAPHGLGPPVRVPVDPADAQSPLARGEVDMVGAWVDSVPWVRRRAGVAVRAVTFGPDFYTTGLVASDRVSPEVAGRLHAAFAAGLKLQRRRPAVGLEECAWHAPGADPLDALEEWSLLEPFLFADRPPASMSDARWRSTLDHATAIHGFPAFGVADVARPELFVDMPVAVP